ncbi:helix-turn-helix domain-containing protein [Halostella litorea]|uniref:hypothetical protein n=1 Tax=Halostella litorea TaxID=2528831 RepID=UPI001091B5C6|nr:hypothetical protein [Halostella litorea]
MATQKTRDEVIAALEEGRVTPRHLLDVTSIDAKQTAQYHLRELRADGRVERVSRGLYELTDDSTESNGGGEVLEALVAALEDDADLDADEFEFGDAAGGSS